MIGSTRTRNAWAQSAVLSILLHGTAVAAVFYRPAWGPPAVEQPVQTPIEVSTLSMTPQDIEKQTLEAASTPELEPLAPVTQPNIQTTAASETIAPVLLNESLPIVSSPEREPLNNDPGRQQDEQKEGETEGGAPNDPRLVELFDRIRDRLTESCLLALPSLRGDNQIQLSILSADDRRITSMMADLTEGISTEVTESAVLLNNKQCPGLTFARRDPDYPILSLGVQLESQNVASGGSLRGQLAGGTGLYNTLLLVDDNGVVHDLRRYLVQSSSRTSFDIPLARMGDARDTHQLIVAIATTGRPSTISQFSGQEAELFFEQLSRELGDDAMIGISSVYVQ